MVSTTDATAGVSVLLATDAPAGLGLRLGRVSTTATAASTVPGCTESSTDVPAGLAFWLRRVSTTATTASVSVLFARGASADDLSVPAGKVLATQCTPCLGRCLENTG